MPIRIQCPNCNKPAQVPDSAIGKTAKCKCGTSFTIGLGDTNSRPDLELGVQFFKPIPPHVEEPLHRPQSVPATEGEGFRRRTWIVASVVILFLASLALIVFFSVTYLWKGQDNQAFSTEQARPNESSTGQTRIDEHSTRTQSPKAVRTAFNVVVQVSTEKHIAGTSASLMVIKNESAPLIQKLMELRSRYIQAHKLSVVAGLESSIVAKNSDAKYKHGQRFGDNNECLEAIAEAHAGYDVAIKRSKEELEIYKPLVNIFEQFVAIKMEERKAVVGNNGATEFRDVPPGEYLYWLHTQDLSDWAEKVHVSSDTSLQIGNDNFTNFLIR